MICAVDGVKSRKFLSKICIMNNIPLFDLGIDKLSGGTNICIPKYT